MKNQREWCEKLETLFHQQIPITASMGVKVEYYDGRSLRLAAPLSPNVNDKGTAFGGSLSSILTLAGWGLMYLRLAQQEQDCDIVIHKGELCYFHPIKGDFHAYCDLPAQGSWDRFIERLNQRGKARLPLRPWIGGDAGAAAIFDASFVALGRNAKPNA